MKQIRWMLGLAVLLACVCVTCASADDATISPATIAHGDPVTITYDLSAYTFDLAELVPIAIHNSHIDPILGRYEMDPIPLPGKSGSITFTDTNLGETMFFDIRLRVSNGTSDSANWPVSQSVYGGDITFSDGWNQPAFPTMTVTYHQTSVTAGTPISADYEISSGASAVSFCEVGWSVYDDVEGWVNAARGYDAMPAKGTVVMDAPTIKGTHYVQAFVHTADGWVYEMEEIRGIEVTTDGTGAPLSIDLSWSDENGNTLDWTRDRPTPNQKIYMSWVMRGGYTPYEGYLNLTPVSGSTNFGSKGYAGAARTLEFVIMGRTELVLSVEYHDNHGNSKTFQVTIPAPQAPPIQLINRLPDHNVYLGMPVYYGGLGPDGELTFGAIEGLEVEIGNYNELAPFAQDGQRWTNPQWSVSLPQHAPFTYETSSWNRYFSLFPSMDLPAAPMDVAVEITCAWAGRTATTTITLHYLPLATVPTDHDYPTQVRLKVGDTLEIAPQPLPSSWSISGYLTRVVLFNDQMDAFAEKDTALSTSQRAVYTVKKAGTFVAAVMLGCDSVYMGHNVFFYVEDANGDVPPPVLELSCWGERNFYIGNGLVMTDGVPLGVPYTSSYLDEVGIWYDEPYSKILQGKPVWNVTSDNAAIQVDAVPTGDRVAEIHLKALPTQEVTAVLHITCTWDTAFGACDLTVHFRKISMPTGIENYYGERTPSWVVVCTGESLAEMDELHLINDHVAEEEERGMWYEEGDEPFAVWGNDGRVAGTPGDYSVTLSTGSCNITWSETCRLVVLRADGTLPKSQFKSQGGGQLLFPRSLTAIADSAFEGTAANIAVLPSGCLSIGKRAFADSALREIDIPASVTSIEEDAFDGCGLLAIYVRGQAALTFAQTHRLVALTDN